MGGRLLGGGFENGSAVKFATDDLVLDTDEVLAPTTAHKHQIVLLQVVALPGHVGHHLAPVAEPNSHAPPVRAIRLLRLPDQRLQYYTLSVGNGEDLVVDRDRLVDSPQPSPKHEGTDNSLLVG